MPTRETLAERQRRLLAVVKGRTPGGGGFPASEMALLRETLLWWRQVGITQTCRFTATLLAAQGRFPAVVEAFVRVLPGADSLELQRDMFLTYVARDRDPLCSAMAATEAAMLRSTGHPGEIGTRMIPWPCDPGPVFESLLKGGGLRAWPPVPYMVTVNATGQCQLDWYCAARAPRVLPTNAAGPTAERDP